MLFLGSSWYEVRVEGSVNAVWVHRFLPHALHEQIHSVVEGCVWVCRVKFSIREKERSMAEAKGFA